MLVSKPSLAVGKSLKNTAEQYERSQVEMARRTGKPRSEFNRVFNDHQSLNAELLATIPREGLGRTLSEFEEVKYGAITKAEDPA